MTAAPRGLHHITCVCHAWERTVAFYEALCFHLVKNTVNHDAPDTRHIYLANASGEPGTTITFFEWPSERRGRPGLTSAQHVGITLPDDVDLDEASERLTRMDAEASRVDDHGTPCIQTRDPDGLDLRLFEGDAGGPRLRHAGLLGAVEERRRYFAEVLGFEVTDEDPARVCSPGGEAILTLLNSEPGRGRMAPGAVHHVAFAVDEDEQQAIRQRLVEAGAQPTDVIDRVYFQSVYARDPGGHILELATLGPGFGVDEREDALGDRLVLPPWLEDQRAEIEQALKRQAEKARTLA